MITDSLSPEAALEQLWEIKAQIEELEGMKADLSAYLETVDPAELRFERGDKRYRATVSRSTATKVNLHRLSAINPFLYRQITKEVVDTEKLKRTIDAGLWTPTLRDECVTFTKSRPSVRFTEEYSTAEASA